MSGRPGGVAALDGVVRHYDWGSPEAIPRLCGLAPDGRPWAELWLGAHPSAPAAVGPGRTPLDRLVAADPQGQLGPVVAERFGTLPFLLKVLAAARPLSLQAHPTLDQARRGFAREEAAGIPVDAPHRSYRDRSHKPELICALTTFDALCGFRHPVRTLALLDELATGALDPVRAALADSPDAVGLSRVLRHLLELDAAEAATLVESVVAACAAADGSEFARERRTALRLAELYPGDAGVVTSLLLNRVTLRPGQALFLGAGNLHAYLGGVGVEIMANSDNVLRGGLTTKHVDVPALLEVVDTSPLEPEVQGSGDAAGGALDLVF
ncbi:MAG: mannose-6-phosphate isomerase, class I, partial [Actinomyces sp.]